MTLFNENPGFPFFGAELKHKSIIIAVTGMRGSGKTLLLVALALEALMLRKEQVWANFKIKNGEYESQPLSRQQLLTFDPCLRNGWLVLDEAQQLYSSRRSVTTGNLLALSSIAQIRKRQLSVLFSAKWLKLVDVNLRNEVDLEITTTDSYHHPSDDYPIEDKKQGSLFFLHWRDLSGIFTGYSYYENFREHPILFMGERYWDCYDTYEEQNALEAFSKVKVHHEEINIGGNGNNPVLTEKLQSVVAWYRSQGVESVSTDEFWAKAGEFGFDGDHRKAGVILKSLGVGRKQLSQGHFYEFSSIP